MAIGWYILYKCTNYNKKNLNTSLRNIKGVKLYHVVNLVGILVKWWREWIENNNKSNIIKYL